MNKKHKGYQDHIVSEHRVVESFLKSKIKFNRIQKFYHGIKVRIVNLKLIPNIKSAKKILDIGCGEAETLKFIREYMNSDAELYGVDLEKNKNLPSFVKFYEVDIEEQKLPFEDEYFDTVISTFVLEHLQNPQQFFLETNRVLKKEGYFYCVTENYTSVFLPGRFNFFSDPTHVRPWTKKSLKALAEISGFKVVKIGHFRPVEYFLLIPFAPILSLIFGSECFIVMYEVFFRKSIYCILKKP
ncbi:class I SAM-dependent methyltransferase [Thermodesulfovibrio sp. 3907-1M]|uniref:Class I SAM-dependent methyltransferase n=1 Tax=Thermodesulfovibrio autotrophicus TaxID=3118333 RepID=A0AAU8GX00_9BACT